MTIRDGRIGDLQVLIEAVDSSDISSIKTIVKGILGIINDPRSSVKDLKELIEVDPPLTARLLRTANSAYYSLQRKVGEIEEAIILIGFDQLKELALSQKICQVFERGGMIEGYSRPLLWTHTFGVATLAKMIYRREFGFKGDDIYAAGLLHDIGIIVEDQFLHRQFQEILRGVHLEGRALVDAEADALGFDHAEIGRALFEYWNFPDDLVESIFRHHDPPLNPARAVRPTLTLFIAHHICQVYDIGYADSRPLPSEVYLKCLETLRIDPASIRFHVEDLKREISRTQAGGLFADE